MDGLSIGNGIIPLPHISELENAPSEQVDIHMFDPSSREENHEDLVIPATTVAVSCND